MTTLLLALTGVLTLLVVGAAVLAVRLTRRVGELEARLAASSDPNRSPSGTQDDKKWSLDAPEAAPQQTAPQAQYVITHLGEPREEHELEPEVDGVPTVAPGLFADIVLRETVVQTASLFHGVRRALSPENRNRIRFEMRREVKRSRKQRRADLRAARREWEARQRAAMLDDQASAA
jgi:hypothetical protein